MQTYTAINYFRRKDLMKLLLQYYKELSEGKKESLYLFVNTLIGDNNFEWFQEFIARRGKTTTIQIGVVNNKDDLVFKGWTEKDFTKDLFEYIYFHLEYESTLPKTVSRWRYDHGYNINIKVTIEETSKDYLKIKAVYNYNEEGDN